MSTIWKLIQMSLDLLSFIQNMIKLVKVLLTWLFKTLLLKSSKANSSKAILSTQIVVSLNWKLKMFLTLKLMTRNISVIKSRYRTEVVSLLSLTLISLMKMLMSKFIFQIALKIITMFLNNISPIFSKPILLMRKSSTSHSLTKTS